MGTETAYLAGMNRPEGSMRIPFRLLLVAVFVTAACEDTVVVGNDNVPAPANLVYEVEPSGDPHEPLGLLLSWTAVSDPDLSVYRVYSRGSTGSSFRLRGETTSNTFHDGGLPHLQYFVTAVAFGGSESQSSNTITVDERLRLETPAAISSITLNGAIHLQWTDNAFTTAPNRFKHYRVYTTSYDLDAGVCGTSWLLDGTTVAPEFLSGALANGAPRCFSVSAVSTEGYESLWPQPRQDTPRPDARNTLAFAYDENVAFAGFRFWEDLNGDGSAQTNELGLVVDGDRTDIDFWIFRDPSDSSLWFVPEFGGTSVQLYSAQPITDLTSIDDAPAGGYTRNMIEAQPGYGYVWEMIEGPVLRYGALRVTHVGRDYVIFDWSFQTDPGNPQLVRIGGVVASGFEPRSR
jgi:hypothetical protein